MEKRPINNHVSGPSSTIKPNQQNSADKPSLTLRPATGGVKPKK
ncbi:hypothetical protein ACBZ92_27805 (plasmid) [Priestia aryabhattai]|nr:hypothetical protein [Priestia aryabhattai]